MRAISSVSVSRHLNFIFSSHGYRNTVFKVFLSVVGLCLLGRKFVLSFFFSFSFHTHIELFSSALSLVSRVIVKPRLVPTFVLVKSAIFTRRVTSWFVFIYVPDATASPRHSVTVHMATSLEPSRIDIA